MKTNKHKAIRSPKIKIAILSVLVVSSFVLFLVFEPIRAFAILIAVIILGFFTWQGLVREEGDPVTWIAMGFVILIVLVMAFPALLG